MEKGEMDNPETAGSESAGGPPLAHPMAYAMAWTAFGLGMTAQVLGAMSKTLAVATRAGEIVAAAGKPAASAPKPAVVAKTATVFSFEEASRSKTTKTAAAGAGVKADDLKTLPGIGPKLEELLNKMGVSTLDQIARWTADDAARMDEELQLNGRVLRDDWAGQAARLAAGNRRKN